MEGGHRDTRTLTGCSEKLAADSAAAERAAAAAALQTAQCDAEAAEAAAESAQQHSEQLLALEKAVNKLEQDEKLRKQTLAQLRASHDSAQERCEEVQALLDAQHAGSSAGQSSMQELKAAERRASAAVAELSSHEQDLQRQEQVRKSLMLLCILRYPIVDCSCTCTRCVH